MDLLSTGDGSGRPDTSGVDVEKAQVYARSMFAAVVSVNFALCKSLHEDLNRDPELYQLSLDLFKAMCKQRGVKIGYWREYTEHTQSEAGPTASGEEQ
jgi:hypothetical protein